MVKRGGPPEPWRLGIRRRTASLGCPQASAKMVAPAPRTWFDTCPGRAATKFTNIYQYLADMDPCWTRILSDRDRNEPVPKSRSRRAPGHPLSASRHMSAKTDWSPRCSPPSTPITGGWRSPPRRIRLCHRVDDHGNGVRAAATAALGESGPSVSVRLLGVPAIMISRLLSTPADPVMSSGSDRPPNVPGRDATPRNLFSQQIRSRQGFADAR